MNMSEIRSMTNSLARNCFESLEVIDHDMGTYIVKYEDKYCIVKINICKECPYELLERFQEKRQKQKEREEQKSISKLKDCFT